MRIEDACCHTFDTCLTSTGVPTQAFPNFLPRITSIFMYTDPTQPFSALPGNSLMYSAASLVRPAHINRFFLCKSTLAAGVTKRGSFEVTVISRFR